VAVDEEFNRETYSHSALAVGDRGVRDLATAASENIDVMMTCLMAVSVGVYHEGGDCGTGIHWGSEFYVGDERKADPGDNVGLGYDVDGGDSDKESSGVVLDSDDEYMATLALTAGVAASEGVQVMNINILVYREESNALFLRSVYPDIMREGAPVVTLLSATERGTLTGHYEQLIGLSRVIAYCGYSDCFLG
jgi:hypothetical protein